MANFWTIAQASAHQTSEAKQLKCQTYLASALVVIYNQIHSNEQLPGCPSKVHDFIKHTYPDLVPAFASLLPTRQCIYAKTEKLIHRRVSKIIVPSTDVVWPHFFHNAQIFIDLYLFRLYCFMEVDTVLLAYLRNQKDQLSFTLLCVIAAAANTNRRLQPREVALFNLFLKHTFLRERHKKTAIQFLQDGSQLSQIDLSEFDSWAIRKFLLESAIATIWSDGILDDEETNFVADISKLLKLTDIDVQSSFVRIESLLLTHSPNELVNPEVIEGCFIHRVKKILTDYKKEIVRLFKSDLKLCDGLRQASVRDVNKIAKDRLSRAIVKQLQSLPLFRGIHFNALNWTYEKLLKILPKDVVRSAIR